jgi:hypothetical protein
MRFMAMIKSADNGNPPPQALSDAMDKEIEDGVKSGIVLDAGGLGPSAQIVRVRLTQGKVRVIDGPYTEAKELVGGYAVLQARSQDEAVEGARRIIQLHKEHWPGWEGEIEVRQIYAPETPSFEA